MSSRDDYDANARRALELFARVADALEGIERHLAARASGTEVSPSPLVQSKPAREGIDPRAEAAAWRARVDNISLSEAAHRNMSRIPVAVPCPECGYIEMVVRYRRDGTDTFLGCPGFPDCRGTRRLHEVTQLGDQGRPDDGDNATPFAFTEDDDIPF